MHNTLSAIVLALSVSLVSTYSSSTAQEPAAGTKKVESGDKAQTPKKEDGPKQETKVAAKDEPKPLSFGPKQILVISTCLHGNPGAILTNATVVKIGTDNFLRGKVPEGIHGWGQDPGIMVTIPVNIITQIVEYEKAEAVNKARGQTK